MGAARANRSSLNVEDAFRHMLAIVYGFNGTVIAGIFICAARPSDLSAVG